LECDRKKRELKELLTENGRDGARGGHVDARRRRGRPTRCTRSYTLQDSGKGDPRHLRGTGLEKGEVELILGLRRMSPENSRPPSCRIRVPVAAGGTTPINIAAATTVFGRRRKRFGKGRA